MLSKFAQVQQKYRTISRQYKHAKQLKVFIDLI